MMIGCTFLTTALVAITAAEFLVQLTVKSLSPYFYIGLCVQFIISAQIRSSKANIKSHWWIFLSFLYKCSNSFIILPFSPPRPTRSNTPQMLQQQHFISHHRLVLLLLVANYATFPKCLAVCALERGRGCGWEGEVGFLISVRSCWRIPGDCFQPQDMCKKTQVTTR